MSKKHYTKPPLAGHIWILSGLERSLWVVLGLFLFLVLCLLFICLCYHQKKRNRIISESRPAAPSNEYTAAEPPPYTWYSEPPPPPYNSKMQSNF